MEADQPPRGNRDWTLLTMRNDGFSMERVEGIIAVQERWELLKLDRNVRAVFAYDPNMCFHDAQVRVTNG